MVSSYFDLALKVNKFMQEYTALRAVETPLNAQFSAFLGQCCRIFWNTYLGPRTSLNFWYYPQSQWSQWYGYRFASAFIENSKNDIYFGIKGLCDDIFWNFHSKSSKMELYTKFFQKFWAQKKNFKIFCEKSVLLDF